jgi:hypothetical protein
MSERLRLGVVAKKSVLTSFSCAVCGRGVKAGEQVAQRRNSLEQAPAYEHYLVLHVSCMSKLVDRAKPEPAELAYDEARKRFNEEMDIQWAKALS